MKTILKGLIITGSLLSSLTFAYDISKLEMLGQACSPEGTIHTSLSGKSIQSLYLNRCFKRGLNVVINSTSKSDSYKLRLVNNSCNAITQYETAYKTSCYVMGTFLLQYPQLKPTEITSMICQEATGSDAEQCYKAALATKKNGWKPKEEVVRASTLINEWSFGLSDSLTKYCDKNQYKQSKKQALEKLLIACRKEGIKCSPKNVKYKVIPSFEDIDILDYVGFDRCNMEASIRK